MKLIAHRGNLDGKNLDKENHPDYIEAAINSGFDAEVDIWLKDEEFWLGHDEPQYNIGKAQSDMWFNFLFKYSSRLWLHCKNLEAFGSLFKYRDLNVFWHDTDAVVLTSKKYLWTFPNKPLLPNSVCVLPEVGINGDLDKCYGLCSDFVLKYKDAIRK
jgi:hypothetical protein